MAEETQDIADSVYYDIEAACSVLEVLETVDLDAYGSKGAKQRITKNCLKILEKGLEYLVSTYEDE